MLKKKDVLDPIAFLLSTQKLKSYLKLQSIDDIVAATNDYVGYGYYDRISMSQKKSEIIMAAERIRNSKPKVIVEIGTRKGGTLFTWARVTKAKLIISIDLESGIHGGGYPPQKKKFYKKFVSDDTTRHIKLIQDDSHKEKTKFEVIKILNGCQIDFLFIDGDHTYNGVKRDFEMYSPLVKKGGIIGFHDIVPNLTDHEDAATIEVPIFWKEIKEDYKHEEIVEKHGKSWMGIGLLYL